MGNTLLFSLYNLEPNKLINIAHKYDASLIVITALIVITSLIDDIPREVILQHSDKIDTLISKNEDVVRSISSKNDPQTTTACAFCFKTEYTVDDPRAKSLLSVIYVTACVEVPDTLPGIDRYRMIHNKFRDLIEADKHVKNFLYISENGENNKEVLLEIQKLFYILDKKMYQFSDSVSNNSDLSSGYISIYKGALKRYHKKRINLQSRYNGIQKTNAVLRIQKHYRNQVRKS